MREVGLCRHRQGDSDLDRFGMNLGVTAQTSKHLKTLGGVDAADHVKKSMTATMTNKMMPIMSLRGRSGKVAFMKTRLYKIICARLPVPVISRDCSSSSSSSSSSSCSSHPNPISNQTQHLNITQLCHTCSDSVHFCGPTEAVIRLVLSALVGVATVILLVYDIRSRRAERDQAHIHTSET
ncbi:unnamed protein product [Leuciscus chuanchicus]